MDLLNPKKETGIPLATGTMLIAEPFLLDPHFCRTVVLLCEYSSEGSVGLILNKPSGSTIDQLLPELALPSFFVFSGGPVQRDNLQLIHRIPRLMGGIEIAPDIFWGGSYKDLADQCHAPKFKTDNIRLFSGYAGWDAGQLEAEIQEGSWLIAPSKPDLVFETDSRITWASALRSLGVDFAPMANWPLHPQLN